MMEKTLCFFYSFCLTCDLFSTTVAMEPDLGDSTLKRNPEETTKLCRVKKAHTAKEIYLKSKNGVADFVPAPCPHSREFKSFFNFGFCLFIVHQLTLTDNHRSHNLLNRIA